jgi:ATP phosphoribosyltransferase regulatory subunit
MIPEGMRDILPLEAEELRAAEAVLRRCFSKYGYGEVLTPWLEFAETLEVAEDDTLQAGYRLTDAQGRQLMVRTDMTVPVARLAATRCRDKPLPLRFCYLAPSIRPWAPQRSQDGEFLQAGAELLGVRSATADAECVMLLCDALSSVGLREYRVALGTVAFHSALVDSLGLDDEGRQKLLEALADHDYPLLESIAAKSDLGDEARKSLQRTLELGGTRDSLAQARKMARNDAMDAALEHLVVVHDTAAEAGFGEALTFDLGLFQDLTYYSGVIFEAYAPGVGQPLASGGRYDGLLARFDWDIPGVGFAIAVDRLLDALREAGAAPATGSSATLAFVGGFDEPSRGAELRRAGWSVVMLPTSATPATRPCIYREGGTYRLEREDGAALTGSWRDVARALGAGPGGP